MTSSEIEPQRLRVLGYDVARAVAIVGMVLINFPIYLASLDGQSGQPLTWLANLHFGRAAALFVTLAGVGISLMARGAARWKVRRTLLLRALFLFVLGNALITVWDIDILHFYAFYLAIAAILLVGLPRWALLCGIILVAALTLAMNIAWPDIASTLDVPMRWPLNGELTLWTPLGMLQNEFISGVHPVLPWIAFLMAGMWIGQHDITDQGTRRAFLALGAALGVGGPVLSALVEFAIVQGGLPESVLLYTGVRHAPSPIYLFAAIGTAMVAIALSQEAASRWPRAPIVRAMAHAGQMALTLYLAHALLGVVIPQSVFGVRNLPLAWVLIYGTVFSVACVWAADRYRARFKRGPIEAVMRWIAGAPDERVAADGVVLALHLARGWPYAAGTGVVLLLVLQIVGAPPSATCAATAIDGARAVGRLTLLCPSQSFPMRIEKRADVTIETHNSRDLVLELYRGSERIAQNDDGGIGVNARLVATLDAGDYVVVARPFEAGLGPFVLTRHVGPPTLPQPQAGQICSDSCASARDGECDDGGPGALYAVCTFGSDCGDCGVRTGEQLRPLLDRNGQLCSDTCGTAHDGECDDGGPNSQYDICSLGSDCSDCGPRAPPR